jgi:uncharacterized protein
MNKKILSAIVILTLIVGIKANAQVISGSWRGLLELGPQKLTTVLHVVQRDKKVSMDIIEQGVNNIPMTVEFLSEDSISVAIPQAKLSYNGKFKDGKLKGIFRQQFFSSPLNLVKGEVDFKRPQEPKQPFPYITDEITFRNKNAGVTLSGTLFLPKCAKTTGKVPVVLMVTGSGPENRDEEMFHHKPFLVIADYLARQGIASLRYDDRGTAESTGNFKTATTFDFANDAQAGIDYLRRSGLFSKVGILGHSEGGMIGYILASRICLPNSKDNNSNNAPDFVISLAGPACKIDSLMMVQLNGLARAQGYSKEIVSSPLAARQLLMKNKSPWMRVFLDINPIDYLKSVHCPVMAIGGEKDLNVPVSINMPSLKLNLPKNNLNLIKVYPGLNHLFQHCSVGVPSEYAKIEETISPEVLNDIATWIIKIK